MRAAIIRDAIALGLAALAWLTSFLFLAIYF